MADDATEMSTNNTGLRVRRESSFKTLGSGDWKPREPNEYGDFGAQLTNTPRKPIRIDRQNRKGVLTDLEAPGSWTEDMTYSSFLDMVDLYLFANYRDKGTFGADSIALITISGITAIDDTYTVASGGASCDADDIVFGSGFTNAGNNGLHVVASSSATTVVVGAAPGLTDEASPPSTATLTRVGHEFAAGDLSVTQPGIGVAYPYITSAGGKDLTELDIVPGEWVYIGGDAALNKWATAANNGYARVRSVTSTVMTFDKTQNTMVTEAGGVLEIRIFLPRVCKNESTAATIIKKYLQIERSLGSPDSGSPGNVQGEYIVGGSADQLTIGLPTSEIITTEYSFLGADHETNDSATGLKSGTRPALQANDGYNSVNHVRRLSLRVNSLTDANPTSLFTYLKEVSVKVENNISLNKAIGVLGGASTNAGSIDVELEAEAYFATVAALAAKRANDDVSFDMSIADQNQGITVDLPLLALGDGLPELETNEPIMLKMTNPAASGEDVVSTLNHTVLICFFDYLPDAAEA